MKDFTLWVPLIKAGDDERSERRVLEGLASNEDRDFQQDRIVQKSLDINYLKSNGSIIWNHEQGPENVIGICEDADFRPEGLWVRGELFGPSAGVERADSAWKLAKAYKSLGSKTRRLGWSIHGHIEERSKADPRDIIRASVHHVALTHEPINVATFALPALAKALAAAPETAEKALTVSAPEHRALALENLSGTITNILWGDCQEAEKPCYDKRGMFRGGFAGMRDHLTVCKSMHRSDVSNLLSVLKANFTGIGV